MQLCCYAAWHSLCYARIMPGLCRLCCIAVKMGQCCTNIGQPRPELHQSCAWPEYLSRFVNIRVFPSIFDAILCVIVESELNKRSNKNEINTLLSTVLHRYNVKWLWCFTVPLHRSHNRRIFTLSFNVGNINDSNCIPKQPYRLRKALP